MQEKEAKVIASVHYRGMDGRIRLEIVKARRGYKLRSTGRGEPIEIPFKNKGELTSILDTWEVVDTPNRDYQTARDQLLTDFWAATELKPDPLDMLLQESKIKNPFL